MEYHYADAKTGFYKLTSDRALSDSGLVLTPSIPKGLDYRWDGDAWIPFDPLQSQAKILDRLGISPEEILGNSNTTLSFADLSKLTIGSDIDDWDSLDILHYKDVPPIAKNNGIYTAKKSYLAFPKLSWDKSQVKTTSFIWYCSSDSRYIVFGLASKERYRWSSNDYNKCEIALRFRTYRGCYYQYGLLSDNSNSFSYKGFEGFQKNQYYRLDIENNGARGSNALLYQLLNGSPSNWFGGSLVSTIALIDPPSRDGQTLTPYLGEYLGSNNYLLAIIAHGF